jgi:predicted lactoylglutathione lyase
VISDGHARRRRTIISDEAFVMLLTAPQGHRRRRQHAMDSMDHGFMHGWNFYDIDGHHWEVLWMDPAAVQ